MYGLLKPLIIYG